jgi:DNA polymerase I-like protein with 3'-5' exonuclease and polymerase domains
MKRCLINFDKAGAEWVIVAHMSQDARMLDVIKSGRSPHTVTGSLITGAPEEVVEKEDKILKTTTDPILIEQMRREHMPELFKMNLLFLPRIFSIRQCGKKSNHGLNYWMQKREFAYQTEMEERDCQRVIDLYTKRAYANIPLWWEAVKRELQNNDRVLLNPFGRKRRFLGEWNRDLWKAAIAHLPQSTNVDMVNQAMKLCFRDDWLMDFIDHILQNHDSILFQAPIETRDDWLYNAHAALKIKKYMEPIVRYGAIEPFRVGTDMKIGPTWGDMAEVKLIKDVDLLAKKMREGYEKACQEVEEQLKKAA